MVESCARSTQSFGRCRCYHRKKMGPNRTRPPFILLSSSQPEKPSFFLSQQADHLPPCGKGLPHLGAELYHISRIILRITYHVSYQISRVISGIRYHLRYQVSYQKSHIIPDITHHIRYYGRGGSVLGALVQWEAGGDCQQKRVRGFVC